MQRAPVRGGEPHGRDRPGSAGPASDPLLQPFRLKHLTLKNRIMSTSHACGLAEGGMPGERYQRYHEAKARGGIALTMFGGSSNVSTESAWALPQIELHDARVVDRFQQFSRRIHAHGARLMCQVTHVGGRGEAYAGAGLPPIGPSPVRETLHRAFASEMDERDIARVVADFAEAAARCKAGGLDGIETFTGAHLIGQFLSPATNRRTDRYGGSLANRCRFGLMVHEAIRKRVGDDFIVGMRFVIDEAGPGHLTFEDGLAIAAIFEASGTIDFFNAIYGRIDTELKLAVDCMPGMASAEAPFLARAGAFKQRVGLPVFHATRITSLETARHAIGAGLLDMVAMTRAHIADPDLVAKLIRPSAVHSAPSASQSVVGASRIETSPPPSGATVTSQRRFEGASRRRACVTRAPLTSTMPPQRVDRLRALAHQKIARVEQHRPCLLLFPLHRHKAHGRALRRLADRLRVRRVVLLPFHERLHVDRRDQPHIVAELHNLSAPMVSARTGLHRHNAAR